VVGLGLGATAAWRLATPDAVAAAPTSKVATVQARPSATPSPRVDPASPARSEGSARGVQRHTAAPPSTDPVLLFGDSLALGLADLLPNLVPSQPVTVQAEVGRGSTSAVYVLGALYEPVAPTWVVSLGTNDYDETVFASNIDAVMADAGHKRCVVWFDVYRPGTDEAINAALAQASSKYRNLHVVPWNALAGSHPEWFSWGDVHPSTQGYAARAEQAAAALATFCR